MTDDLEIEPVRLCDASNEAEATLIVNLLQDDGIPARTDATQGSGVFGGLPFESGHGIFVMPSYARRAREVLSNYPHFQDLKNVHEPTSD